MSRSALTLTLVLLAPLRLDAQPARGEWLTLPRDLGPDTLAWKRYPIEVYTNTTSVVQGGSIDIMVAAGYPSLAGQPCRVQVYRLGASDSLYFEFTLNALVFQPLHDSLGNPIAHGARDRKPKEYKRGCRWPRSRLLTIPLAWPSGVYVVKCTLYGDTTVSRRHPFVVRAASPGSTSRILYKVPISEYHAYSSWGGGSLYWWSNGGLDATDTVSFLRPIASNYAADDVNDLGSLIPYERDFIAWAEQAGYTMEYCTNIDIHTDSLRATISPYRLIVVGGHDEYWSRSERQAVESQFLAISGNNTAFLSANICYWRVEYPASDNFTRMWCLKDPQGTNLWRNTLPEGPEAKFIGVQYDTGYNNRLAVDTVRRADHWLFRGTGLRNRDAFGFGPDPGNPGILGAEVDRVYPDSPPNVQVLASAWVDSTILGDSMVVLADDDTIWVPVYGSVLHESVYYENEASNARAFAAATQRWGTGLAGYDSLDRSRFRTYAANLMDHFSGRKYIGNVYSDPLNPLRWSPKDLGRDSITLDGDVRVLAGKALLDSSCTVVADSVLFVDGTFRVEGAVLVTGRGSVNINPGGTLALGAGAVLTVSPTAYFVLEPGGTIQFGVGSRLVLNNATIEPGAALTVAAGGTLELRPGGTVAFGSGSGMSVSGALTAVGTPESRITLRRAAGSIEWSGITVNPTASASLRYCDILHARSGILSSGAQPEVSQCRFDSCAIGMYLFQSAGRIDSSVITHCSVKGVVVDGEYSYADPPRAPGLAGNVIAANDAGVYVTAGAPVMLGNSFQGNASAGLWCENGGSPFLGKNEAGSRGDNNFSGNIPTNLLARYYSIPFLGYRASDVLPPQGGYNGFGPSMGKYDVTAQFSSGVQAMMNWWGEYPPDEPSSFSVEPDSSWVDWSFPLEGPGSGPASRSTQLAARTTAEGLDAGPDPLASQLSAVLGLRWQGKYGRAMILAKEQIAAAPGSPLAPLMAVVHQETARDSARASARAGVLEAASVYADSLLAAGPPDGLRRMLLNRKLARLMEKREWAGVVAMAEDLSSAYRNSALEEHALYAAFRAALLGAGDRGSAEGLKRVLQTRYPESHLAEMAGVLLRSTTPLDGSLGEGPNRATPPQQQDMAGGGSAQGGSPRQSR